MTQEDTLQRWCLDTNVFAHVVAGSTEGATYRDMIATGDLIMPMIVLQELQLRQWSEGQLDLIGEFADRGIVPDTSVGAANLDGVRAARNRLGLQQGVGEADLEIIAVAAAIGAVFVSHDRSAVRVARAAGVAYHTELRGMNRVFALDDRALARARRREEQ